MEKNGSVRDEAKKERADSLEITLDIRPTTCDLYYKNS